MNAKERILGLIEGKPVDRVACFNGMGTVWGRALSEYGYRFAEIHCRADRMAAVAAYPALAHGYECAVVPFDLCIEAEILGCETNFYLHQEKAIYPKISRPVIFSENDLGLAVPERVAGCARVPVVTEAISRAKEMVGKKVPVGTYVLGPYTLAGQIM
ncbi:MAG: methyltransferase, partial [Firmicutes bacterium]|nr:methyltransferase [Bacillota bacterium]